MTFDENAEYIEENFDPSNYPSFDHFQLDVYRNYAASSNNPNIVLREDITKFMEDLYSRSHEVFFEPEEEEIIEQFLPPTEEELVKEITEPTYEELEEKYENLLVRYYNVLKEKLTSFFKRSPF